MKKRILSFLLALVMVVGLLPATALAAPADNNAIKLDLVKDETTFSGKTLLRVDFYAKSGTDTPNNHMVYLKYDASKLYPAAAATGADASAYANNFSISMAAAFTKNNYQLEDPILGAQPSEVMFYTTIQSGYGYICWKVTEPNGTAAFAEYTRISSIFFGLKEGISFTEFPKDAIAYKDATATDTLETPLTAEINVNGGGGENTLKYKPKTGTGNMTIAPTIVAGSGVVFAKSALAGSVSITGTAKIGQTLTADTTGITSTDTGDLTYKWYRVEGATETQITGASGANYTLTSADVGKAIKVVVTAENYSGSVGSPETAKVEKADAPAAPGAPTCKKKDATSVTLTELTGGNYQYSKDGTNWQDSNVFTGLNPNTEYSFYLRIKETETHKASAASAALKVTTDKASADDALKATLRAAVTAYNGTYDGADHDAFTVGTLPTGWTVSYGTAEAGPFSTTMPKLTNVSDSKTLYVKFSNTGYGDVVMSYAVKVNQKDIGGATITITPSAQKTYNGTKQYVVIDSVKVGGKTLTKETDYTTKSGDSATDVTETTLTIEGKGNYTGTATAKWTLKAKDVTVAMIGAIDDKTYTGSEQEPELTVKDGAAPLTKGTHYTVAYSNSKFVGTATATITGKGNYTGTASKTFQIKPAVQTPSITKTATLAKGGNTLDLTTLVSGAKGTVTFSWVSGDAATQSGNILTSSPDKTGDVKISVHITEFNEGGDSAAEYQAYTATGIITVTVTDKATAALPGGVSQSGCTYGETLADPTYTAPTGTTKETVTYSGTLTKGGTYAASTTKPTEAGDYTVTVQCETATTIYSASADFTISQKSISGATVTLDKTTMEYNNGLEQTVSVTEVEGGLTASDYDVSGQTKGTDADTYTVTVTGKGNYKGSTTATWTITQKTILISTATAQKRVYSKGNNAVSINSVGFSGASLTKGTDYTATGVMADDTAGDSKSVTVTVELKGKAAQNYKLTKNTFTANVEIEKAAHDAQSISGANPIRVKYGTACTVNLSDYIVEGGTASYSYVGETATSIVVLSPAPSVDGTQLKFTCVNDKTKVTATTAIYLTVTSDNYKDYLIIVTVMLIDKNAQVISADAVTATYGESKSINATLTTGDGALTYAVTTGTDVVDVNATTGALTFKKAGTATVTVTAAETADYAQIIKNVAITVNKAALTVTAKDQSIYVNGTLPDLSAADAYTVTGLVNGDAAPTVTLAYSAAPDVTKTGSYDIVVTATADESKYDLTSKNGKLTISERPSAGGSYDPSYAITVENAENGAVKADRKSATSGTVVTLTVTPDKGYGLKTLTVLDKNGKEVKLTEKNGKYTFAMPASKVTVKAAFAKEVSYVDVPADAYYADAVQWAAEKDITGGVGASRFAPDMICDRAQAVTFLWRAVGSPAPKNAEMPFTDVKAGSYYYDAVLWAVENGITKGTGAATFSPDMKCSRAQIVTFLWRSQKAPMVSAATPFADVKADAYYADAVLWAVKNGVTTGTAADMFSPDVECSRAEIVTFLYRCMK